MEMKEILGILGNGDESSGKELLEAVAKRMQEAREKHTVYARDYVQALQTIKSEVEELDYAVKNESVFRQFDESLDVIVTAWRFANAEPELKIE